MASKTTKSAFVAPLRTFALGLPGAYEDHPWGETVAKVAKKVFVFLGHDADTEFGMSVKLLTDWILESYRAIAPKKMLAELEARRLQDPSQQRATKTAKQPGTKKRKPAPKK